MPVLIQRFTHPEWLSNAWLLADRPGGSAFIVDTGVAPEPVIEAVRRANLKVCGIINTHHHYDHVAANEALRRELGAPTAAHSLEAERMTPRPGRLLADGERLEAGSLRARVMHIPGHTTGQIALVVALDREVVESSPKPEPDYVLTGDTLFRRSVGGTVGPGHGTFAEIRASLLDRLLALPADTIVLPGHGETTTIGEEREHNPFLRVLRGTDAPGVGRCRFAGRPARLCVWARDYDGGFKALVRFDDGADAFVPGSRVTVETLP